MNSPRGSVRVISPLVLAALFAVRPSLGSTVCAACPNASFGPAPRAFVAGLSTTLAVADFTGDGIPDAAIDAYRDSTHTENLEVLQGDGNGSFGPPIVSVITDHPYSLIAADFDGDGKTDLLVEEAFALKIYLGNGDGTFQDADSQRTVPVSGVVQPTVADFNRDGIPDIAITYPALEIFFGNGDGSFASPVTIDQDDTFFQLTIGDVTGNGLNDILAQEGDGITLFRSNGDGTFTESGEVVHNLFEPVLGDFNHDGIPDIAGITTVQVGDFGSENAVGVVLGQGDGAFGPLSTYIVDDGFSSLIAADVDADGSIDLLALTTHVNVLRNLGNGTFSVIPAFPLIANPSSVAIVDLNGDGYPDFVSSAGGAVVAALGGADGLFTTAPSTGGAVPPSSFPVATGDFEGNGRLGVLVLTPGVFSPSPGSVSVLLNAGGGQLMPPVSFFPGLKPTSAAVGDFNGDGADDLVIGSAFSPDAIVFISTFDGHFSQGVTIPGLQGPFVTGDFNNDGHVDVLGNGGSSGNAEIALGVGDGSFLPAVETSVPIANLVLGWGPGYAVGDFNNDGNLDVASATNGSTLAVCLGTGDGSFGPPATYSSDHALPTVAVGDFDGDGNADIVLAANLYLGNGDGTFTESGDIPSIAEIIGGSGDCCAETVAAADVNQDGISDLLVRYSGSADAAVLTSNGDGSFAEPVGYMGRLSSGMLVGDFTGDSLLDIFLGDSLLINTNCEGHRLQIVQQPSSCDSAGGSFATPPEVAITDDGGNVFSCAPNAVSVAIGPRTGSPGAQLNGNTTVQSSGGFATFTDLSVNEPGKGYRLVFASNGLASVGTRSFTQSLTLSLPPTAFNCSGAPTEFSAPTGMDSYAWSLDGSPVSRASEALFPGGLPSGEHQLHLLVSKDGCTASSDTTITVSDPPGAPSVSAPAYAAIGATGLTASASPSDGSYLWLIRRNGNLSGGGNSNTTTFDAGAPGSVVNVTAVLLQGGCAASTTATVPVDFADVGLGNLFHDQIDALSKLGVTLGCGGGQFCPDATLTRGQMAALIARAHDGSDDSIPHAAEADFGQYDCDQGGVSHFADVAPTDLFCRHIHRIAALGITLGCDQTPDFCPAGLVTREQMALFIGRAIAPSATPPSAYSDGGTGRSYDCSVASPFSDVAANTASCNAIGYIWARGIVDGFGNGTFGPQLVLTRAPAAKFIANAFGLTLGP